MRAPQVARGNQANKRRDRPRLHGGVPAHQPSTEVPGLKQRWYRMEVATRGRGFVEISAPILRWVAEPPVMTGLLTIWCRHTSASLLVQENADPDVRRDLEAFFARIVPEGDAHPYIRDTEGPDDMPAHIR